MLKKIDLSGFQKDIILWKGKGSEQDIKPSTSPFIATGIDLNPYICKLYTDEIGNLPIINEYICYLLAKEFNLPLEEAVLVNVTDEVLTNSTELKTRGMKSNLGFALKWNKKANANVRQPAFERCTNINIIPMLLYFDQLILNQDRALNDGNLLFDSKQNKLVVIDHSHVFNLGEVWDVSSLAQDKDKWLVDNFDEKYYNMLRLYVDGNSPFNETMRLASQLTHDRIIEIVNSVPEEWEFEDTKKEALIEFLCYRNDHFSDIIQAIKPFCLNWKGGIN